MTEQTKTQLITVEPAAEARELVEPGRSVAFFVPFAEWKGRRPDLSLEGNEIAEMFNANLLDQLPNGTQVTNTLSLKDVPGVREQDRTGAIVFVFRE